MHATMPLAVGTNPSSASTPGYSQSADTASPTERYLPDIFGDETPTLKQLLMLMKHSNGADDGELVFCENRKFSVSSYDLPN